MNEHFPLEQKLTATELPFWPHHWDHDPRSPIWTFSLPAVVDEYNESPQVTTTYGLYIASVPFWVELAVWLFAVALLGALFSPLVYLTLVEPRERRRLRKQEEQAKKDDSHNGDSKGKGNPRQETPPLPSLGAFLLSFGLFLPFWIFVPVMVTNALGTSNQVFRFASCVVHPTMSIFRIVEALFGFIPYEQSKCSMYEYALYFATPSSFVTTTSSDDDDNNRSKQFTKKGQSFVPLPLGNLPRLVLEFVKNLLVFSVIWSIFQCFPSTFPAFGKEKVVAQYDSNEDWHSFAAILNLRRQKNSILYAFLIQLTLSLMGAGIEILSSLTSMRQVHPINDHPFFFSSSPAEFWGRRWNSIIHEGLKNGIYKPVRFSLRGGTFAAVVASFIASGLFHEWLMPCVFSTLDLQHRRYGGPTVFFLWQAMMIALENLYYQAKERKYLPVIIPKIVKLISSYPVLNTALVISLGLPLAHWFYEAYIKSDLFLHESIGLFVIAPISQGVAH